MTVEVEEQTDPRYANTVVMQRQDGFRVHAFFAWFDWWIGAYWDRSARVLYVCPVPMFGIKVFVPHEGFRRLRQHWLLIPAVVLVSLVVGLSIGATVFGAPQSSMISTPRPFPSFTPQMPTVAPAVVSVPLEDAAVAGFATSKAVESARPEVHVAPSTMTTFAASAAPPRPSASRDWFADRDAASPASTAVFGQRK